MRCVHISARKAALILFSLLINGVQHTQMADNNMHLTSKDQTIKNTSNNQEQVEAPPKGNSQVQCPSGSNKTCEDLGQELSAQCMRCELNRTCIYGQEYTAECTALYSDCEGEQKTFKRSYICRYCYQTESWEHTCNLKANCNSIATTRSPYTTNCTVRDDILCLGERRFNKNVLCNWTGGYRWSTALILSITLGGFGADRFYLGHWQEGIGKLFSFGGLGVWTLIDVILISLHYLGPADGSLYI